MRRLLPGLLVAALVTAVALLVPRVLTVSALVVAIAVGAVLRNVGALPETTRPGLAWAARRLLRAGVVLLGLQLSLPAVADLGVRGVVVIVVSVAVTFAATVLLGPVLGVSRRLTLLVATGFSICGAAAVAAMSAVVDPDGEAEEDTATAVALVTLFGTVALVALPLLVGALGLSDDDAGLWIGASVHEVAQVVAAGGAVSAAALAVATVTKLGRVVLLAPLVAGVGAVLRARSAVPAGGQGGTGAPASRPPLVPLFVLGFLAAVALRSTGLVPDVVLDVASQVTTALLTAAMVGLGAGVDLRRLLRTGGRAAVLGAASTVVAASASAALILAMP
ncbi:putative sulfate exporter family transporter [Actinotalea sp. JY-7885]|uniref:YeiH family protein n=1 Tax=Actinotalea sp. JY-7885 TaxID=2758576 RepID=UPI001CB7018C|nr:putative sulfate exporter family transporter [Actinotalea sp. JY-7885]